VPRLDILDQFSFENPQPSLVAPTGVVVTLVDGAPWAHHGFAVLRPSIPSLPAVFNLDGIGAALHPPLRLQICVHSIALLQRPCEYRPALHSNRNGFTSRTVPPADAAY
jgi:hypothetical protein